MQSTSDWLHSLGLDQYAKVFVDNDIDIEVIASLSEQDLEKLGVSMGHRKKLLKAMSDLGSAATQNPSPYTSPRQYTPAHLAERILTSKSALEGERKQVTVLFADLKGSMELLADRDPEEARGLLDPVLEKMMEAVHRYEGTVNQVMGDGIMALFGAPLALEDHAVRACYAALRMQESVKRYAEEVFRTQGLTVRIRAGLNSGEVVVRSIGSDLHMDYTAVGQTTHLAARMEQLADPGSTLITAATLNLAEGFVQVSARGPAPVKGLSEPVEVFELTGAGSVRTRLQAAVSRGLTKFVGRSAELTQMFSALERSHAGHGQIVALVGEPGVGKSRLVWEFTHSHRTQGWLILESSSVSYGKASAYRPVIDLLKNYFQIEDRDDERRMREKATGKLLTLDDTFKPHLVPLLALLDVAIDDEKWKSLDPVQKRMRTLDACKRLILREAQVQPLVLVFEDLHWIDSETQALLDTLVESLPTARLLLLVNFRPEYQSRWGTKTYYTQLRIDPLSGESAEELARSLLGGDASVQPLALLLIERTEGNPLYLEESVRTLVETGVLKGERSAYRLTTPITSIQVPATVQAILAARIDRLAPEDKHLLQAAAVIGKDVPYTLLQAIVELPEEALRQRLATLQAGEFVYEKSLFPDLEYTFKHALTHEVAYGSVLQERRKVLHTRIMESIERLYSARLAEQVERLAHHALHAELWEEALGYLQQAAGKASSRWAFREAARHLEQAMEVIGRLPNRDDFAEQEIDIRLDLRSALMPAAQNDRIAQILPEAVALAGRIGDRRRLAQAHAYEAFGAIEMCRQPQALEFGHRSLALAEETGEPALILVARHLLCQVYYTLGDYSRAIDVGLPALDASDEVAVSALQRTYSAMPYYLVHANAEAGQFRDALSASEIIMRRAEAAGHPFAMQIVAVGTGYMYVRQGFAAHAIPVLERAVKLCETYSIDLQIPWTAACLGLAYAFAGRLEEGIERAKQGVRCGESLRLTRFQPLRMGMLANAYLLAGRRKDAQETAASALDLARRYREPGPEAWSLYLLAEGEDVSRSNGVAEARSGYLSALHLSEELGMHPLIAHCHMGLGQLHAKHDDKSTAQTELQIALSMYRDMGMQYWLEKAEVALNNLSAR